jgi:hypothetical protein
MERMSLGRSALPGALARRKRTQQQRMSGSETAFADPLAKHELSNLSPGKL